LRYDDATGNWHFGAIDWDEFQRVLRGEGPCNRERLAARRQAHDDGAWVRAAAEAHAAKRAAGSTSEAA
ncbi:MAG TPA: 1,2-phenylacetyl-CoA epoxidase subunit A, partial [Gemmatimonadaceae bacterium]|nr:1,2-phenylacetyl-CoA epoxidase subunit A [Gemmatimonadaceae bacterium]